MDIAIKTANDDTIKQQFKQRIQDNKYRLYGNMSGSHEFYDWLRKKLMPLRLKSQFLGYDCVVAKGIV